MARYGMVFDLDKCTGCRACMVACKVENNTPESTFYMYVFRLEEGEYPNTKNWFMPRPCMHCDNPPCAKVCPVGARYKREDGLVITDADRCIGCRYCQVSCPYGVNYFNWKDPEKSHYMDWNDKDLQQVTGGSTPPYKNPDLERKYGKEKRLIAGSGHYKGTIGKCTFCVHRLEKGLEPACVETCPTRAIHFGDMDDLTSDVSRVIRQKPHYRLLDEMGTKPRIAYVGGHSPDIHVREIEKPKGRA